MLDCILTSPEGPCENVLRMEFEHFVWDWTLIPKYVRLLSGRIGRGIPRARGR